MWVASDIRPSLWRSGIASPNRRYGDRAKSCLSNAFTTNRVRASFRMDKKEQADIDVQQLLAALRPPSIPDEAFDDRDADLRQIRTWKKSFVVSVLAALSTVPEYHANGIRLDWLQRLVLSKADGQRKPTSDELSRALNAGLDRARVLRLEARPKISSAT